MKFKRLSEVTAPSKSATFSSNLLKTVTTSSLSFPWAEATSGLVVNTN